MLLAHVRDERFDRTALAPGRHWARWPELLGGRDLRSGGTWLAVNTGSGRIACLLNGRGQPAPDRVRRTRGDLPLVAAATGGLDGVDPGRYDPFHLLYADRGNVWMASWDGTELRTRPLDAGVHVLVNHAELAELEMSPRVEYFRPRFAAARPAPTATGPTEQAWRPWLSLLDGGGLALDDPRALVHQQTRDGVRWGTVSATAVGLSADGIRYDFRGEPDREPWRVILPGSP